MKKSYTATFKARVVLELLKQTKTLTQLATEHGVHPNILRAWRDQAIKELPSVFEQRDTLADTQPPMPSNCSNSTPKLAGSPRTSIF